MRKNRQANNQTDSKAILDDRDDKEKERIRRDNRYVSILSGACIGVDLLVIQAYISLSSLDQYEQMAVICFAIAIPILAGCTFVCAYLKDEDGEPFFDWEFDKRFKSSSAVIFGSGCLQSVLGIAFTFLHFFPLAGGIFFAMSVFVIGPYFAFVTPLKQRRKYLMAHKAGSEGITTGR